METMNPVSVSSPQQLAAHPTPRLTDADKTHRSSIQKTDAVHHVNDVADKPKNDSVMHIVYDVDTTAHRIWLNVVDPQSGQVLLKLPPQAVRNIVDSLAKSTPFDARK